MKTLEIIIEKDKRKAAWGEHLAEAGFERDQFENKYKKRIVTWSQDGVDYIAKASTNANGDLVLILTEYK